MSLSYYTSSSTNNLHQKSSPNVCFTLPITCQICLGKVKEPVVCPNLHAFCSFCIDIWLEKSKQCPTCRVPISKENPCRKILGGSDTKDDLLVPTDFSHASTRKARFYALFQQYEDEINRLLKQVDSLNNEITQLKDPNRFIIQNGSPNSTHQDMVQLLRIKLEQLQSNYDEISRDKDRLKESNKKLESENSILLQEIQRLKATINETKSQMTSRYTVAALETKLENYEKEIKQLQKALEKSDNYILELENTYIKKKTSPSSTTTHQYQQAPPYSPKDQKSADDLKFIKGDNLTFKNELKVVKFVENNEIINNGNTSSKQNGSTTTKNSYLSINDSTNKISNDKFYGSPKKLPSQQTSNHIASFNERLKKNLSFDLEIPSPLTQSLNNSTFNATANANASNLFNSLSYNDLLNDSTLPAPAPAQQNNQQTVSSTTTATMNGNYSQVNSNHSSNGKSNPQHDFLFSPMKRLRLEEFQLEKPNFSTVEDDTLNQTAFIEQQKPSQQLNMSLTPEFNDCLQLLNEAESKIQNRSSPFVSKYQSNTKSNTSSTASITYPTVSILKSNSILPDKYLRPQSQQPQTQQQQQQLQHQQRSPSSYTTDKQASPTATTTTGTTSSIRHSNSYDFKLNTDQFTTKQPSPSSNSNNYDYYAISSGTNLNGIYGTSPYRSRSVEPKS